jgi:1-acyl-sn-glycerol-3-phosphate acyltransferase
MMIRKRGWAPLRSGYWLAGAVVRVLARLLFGLRVYGRERVPLEGRLILVGNHISNYDPPIFGAIIPREVHFAAKSQLFKGIVGRVIRYLNSIPVRRSGSDKEAIKALVGALKREQAVLIFPEGTRVLNPDEAQIKAGVGMLATLGKADLLPMRIDGSQDIPRNLFRRGGVTVRFGEVIPLEQVLAETEDRKRAYQEIAERVMAQIRDMAPEEEEG